MNTTLVTEVTVHAGGEAETVRDVPTRVERGTPFTRLEFTVLTRGVAVDIRLTNGERIALIEALGGRDGDG